MKHLAPWLIAAAVAVEATQGCAFGEEGGAVIPTRPDAGQGGSSGAHASGGSSGSGATSSGGSAALGGNAGAEGGTAGTGANAGSSGAGAAGNGGSAGSGVGGKGGSSSGGTGGSATGGAGGTGGSGGIPCNATNTCMGATSIGTVSGDDGSDQVTQSGATGQWLKLRVSEDDSSPLAQQMHVALTLSVPSGLNFDLYAYLDVDNDVVECGKVMDFSMKPAGTSETIDLVWGETGTFANNSDDDRWVMLEVRYLSGDCDASKKWTLTAKGN